MIRKDDTGEIVCCKKKKERAEGCCKKNRECGKPACVCSTDTKTGGVDDCDVLAKLRPHCVKIDWVEVTDRNRLARTNYVVTQCVYPSTIAKSLSYHPSYQRELWGMYKGRYSVMKGVKRSYKTRKNVMREIK